MALEISKAHTALLVMDFENDIVHPEGAPINVDFYDLCRVGHHYLLAR